MIHQMRLSVVVALGTSPTKQRLVATSRPEFVTYLLATGKYGCTEVQVYPVECGQQLGRDPSNFGSSKSLVLKSFFLGREHIGTRPCQSPSHFGIRLDFLGLHFPSPRFKAGPQKNTQYGISKPACRPHVK